MTEDQQHESIRLTNRQRIVLKVLGIFAGLGAAGFALGLICTFIGLMHLQLAQTVCFPLGDVTDVVARSNGDVCVALCFYGRVQVYDQHGRFRHGFFVDSGGGMFRLEVDAADNLTVLPARGENTMTYTRQDVLASTDRKVKADFKRRFDGRNAPFCDTSGRCYRIATHLSSTQIIRTDADGKSTAFIQTPWVLRPFAGPRSWLTLVVFAGLYYLYQKRIQLQHEANTRLTALERSSDDHGADQ